MRRYRHQNDNYVQAEDGQWCHVADVAELEAVCQEILDAHSSGELGLIGRRDELVKELRRVMG